MSWLSNLKEGDQIIVNNQWRVTTAKVDRLTATQIIVGPDKFKRTNGVRIGGSIYDHTKLLEPTLVLLNKAEQQRLRRWLENMDFDEVSLEQLRAMERAFKGEPA